jgi:hypothetical protein
MEEQTVDDPNEESRWAYLARRYPNQNDPRRSPDFGSRRTDAEIRDLLCAILDELQLMNRRADSASVTQEKS